MFDSSRTARKFYEIEEDVHDVMNMINEGFNIGREACSEQGFTLQRIL